MAKKSKPLSIVQLTLVSVVMPFIALVLLLIAVTMNQHGGSKTYSNTFDATFYGELVEVVLGYTVAFVITASLFFIVLMKLERKQLYFSLAWLSLTLLFWRFFAMNGVKSLDCGGGGWSSSCTQLIPNKLDSVITAVVAVVLILLTSLAYGWLRILQADSR